MSPKNGSYEHVFYGFYIFKWILYVGFASVSAPLYDAMLHSCSYGRRGAITANRPTWGAAEQPSSLKIHSDTPGHGHIVKMAIGEGRFFEHQTGDVFIHFCVMCDVKRYLNIASRAPQRRSLAQKRDSLSVTIRDPLTHICLEESSFSAFCVFIMQSRGEMAVNVRFLRP